MSSPSTYDSPEFWPLSARLWRLAEAELEQGETVAWRGQPSRGRYFLQAMPIVAFAIPWTAFALFWEACAAGFQLPNFQQPGQFFFALFGLPFLLIGFGMLSTPFWAARNAKNTLYVLTDRRAIIFEGGWGTKIRSFGPDRLRDLHRRQFRNGSGDVLFEEEESPGKNRSITRVGFVAVANVKDVEDRVRRLAAKADAEPEAEDSPSHY